ncbi:474_t:CDS:2 [Acaulospora colombiana]|uniref:474_t:CDS:1 n=1 Tax=Acaulospora colombiana TaxID=27376 RepID=A0ACA9K7E7_9GLOM|nr:474_t:CDS:2 [Acaulospora colombiana]
MTQTRFLSLLIVSSLFPDLRVEQIVFFLEVEPETRARSQEFLFVNQVNYLSIEETHDWEMLSLRS